MHSFLIITQHYLFSKQKTEPDTQALLILLVLFEKTHAVLIPLCLLRLRRLRLMNRLCKRVAICLALLTESSRTDRLPQVSQTMPSAPATESDRRSSRIHCLICFTDTSSSSATVSTLEFGFSSRKAFTSWNFSSTLLLTRRTKRRSPHIVKQASTAPAISHFHTSQSS